MTLKEKILTELENNRETTFSGQFLAEKFSVSRNAVWKAIQALKEDGHSIESVSRKGYRLLHSSNILSKEGISQYIMGEPPLIKTYANLDSTNDEAKRLLVLQPLSDALILAEEQSRGRGRNGHSFYSPAYTGLYMSIILKLDVQLNQALILTSAAAVAVVRAIYQLCNIHAQIKWVNDIYYQNKKICGILTEAMTDFESGQVDSVIIGIGINIDTNCFPKELQNVAASLFHVKEAGEKRSASSAADQAPQEAASVSLNRNQLAASIYNELKAICSSLWRDFTNESGIEAFMEEYRGYSMILGKKVRYHKQNQYFDVLAKEIKTDGSLVILYEDGTEESIRSGEIRIL